MASKFLTSKERAEKGRAMRRPSPKAHDEVMKALKGILKEDSVLRPEKHRVVEYIEPLIFAIAGQRESDGIELGMAGSLRICLSGCREVLCTQYEQVMNHLIAQHGTATPKAVLEFLANASTSSLATFSARYPGTMWRFTCSSQFEGVYMPPGCVYHERTQAQDVLGIRVGMLAWRHKLV